MATENARLPTSHPVVLQHLHAEAVEGRSANSSSSTLQSSYETSQENTRVILHLTGGLRWYPAAGCSCCVAP